MQDVEKKTFSNKVHEKNQNGKSVISRVSFELEKFTSAQNNRDLSSSNQNSSSTVLSTSSTAKTKVLSSNLEKVESNDLHDLQPSFLTDSSDSDDDSVSESLIKATVLLPKRRNS
jgi:hypothetical protein